MVYLKVHWLWFEFFHLLLSKNNVTAERRFRQTEGEARDPENIEDPRTHQVGVQDHLGAGD